MKKLFSMILVLSMILSMAPAVFAAETAETEQPVLEPVNQEELIEAYREKFVLRPEFDADHCPVIYDDKGKWWAIIGIADNKENDNIRVVPFNERNSKKHWNR